jgi:hypothetical protein
MGNQTMDIFIKFKNNFQYIFDYSIFGFSITDIVIILISCFLALVIRGIFVKIIIMKIKKLCI